MIYLRLIRSKPKILNRVGKINLLIMKKPSLKNKLAFNKAIVSELNQDTMKKVVGGTGNGVMATYDEHTNIISTCTPDLNPFPPKVKTLGGL